MQGKRMLRVLLRLCRRPTKQGRSFDKVASGGGTVHETLLNHRKW